jgi:hypothetical protein
MSLGAALSFLVNRKGSVMKNLLFAAFAATLSVCFAVDAEAGCGRSSCGSAGKSRGKVFSGKFKEVLSSRSSGSSSCSMAPKASGCAECKEAIKEVAPAKTDKK